MRISELFTWVIIVEMDAKKTLATNLQALRKSRGFTQVTLAAEVGCSTSTIRDYENLQRFPGPENLDAIASCLGVSISDLLKSESDSSDQSLTPKDLLERASSFFPLISRIKDWPHFLSQVEQYILSQREYTTQEKHDLYDDYIADYEKRHNPQEKKKKA